MSFGLVLLLALGIGVVAGLRCMTAPAVVAWAAHIGWINLHGSPLAFMGTAWAVGVFTMLALIEFVADQLPSTPPRTAALGLSARIVTGALTGAIGGIAGAFAGYHARVGLVRTLRVPDLTIAIPEDLIAIGLGLLLVSRF